jgi:hypothetical protein
MNAPRLPLPVALSAVAAVALVLVIAALADGVPTFVVRVAELALAAGAAYLVDDAAAAVTVASPQGVWRRRAPVLGNGAAILAFAWVSILAVLTWQASPLSLLGLTGEVVVLRGLAVSAAAVLARTGEPEPGGQVAPAVVLLGLTAVIMEPVLQVTIFVSEDGTGGAAHQLAWLGTAVLAGVVVVLASRDPAAR